MSEESRTTIILEELRIFLRRCGYPNRVIQIGMEKAESRSLGGEKKGQGEETSNNFDIPFITTHNPNDNDCYPIVKEVCEMLKKDENMEKVFKNVIKTQNRF